ncbi:MAG: hypothetical protein IKG14_05480 [Clostridia bacterium]|nr:hypothetical protein [Clostridia bacterium]
MADRRIGERRAPEKGIIKIPLKRMILYLIFAIILLSSVVGNIILSIMYSEAKKEMDFYTGSYTSEITENESPYEVHVEADKEQISPGETVNFNISVKVNDPNSKGVIMLESMFLYDTEYFDCKVIGATSNNWEIKYILNNYFIANKKDLLPSYGDEIVAKVSFTAKKKSSKAEQTISFEQFKITTENEEKVEFPAQSVSVIIK